MEIVIDAQIIKGYYEENILGIDVVATGELTASPTPLFERLGVEDICYLNEIIEYEWRQPIEREWFDAWYGDLLAKGAVLLISGVKSKEVENKLRDKGFPQSRDKHYVRVCCAVIVNKLSKTVCLISDDSDFHDPTKKCGNSATRIKLLRGGNGGMCKILKKYGVFVVAICNYV